MQTDTFYTVDLAKIGGSGEFSCPRCGTEMSPDDETEDVYTILRTVMKRDVLERLVLKCNRCGSCIHVVGFNFLDECISW